MSKSSNNKSTLQVELTTLVTGLQALTGMDSFVLANQTITKTDIITAINAFLSALNAQNAAFAQYKATLSTAKAAKVQAVSFRTLLKAFFVNRFGKGSPQLVSLSFGPVPKSPTVATKATAVAKAKATRSVRHTMGKQQKKALVGTVTSTDPTTPSPATPQNGAAKPAASS